MQAADNGANRMVRMARSQAGVHEDLAKRAIADSHAARERRSGAARMNKRDFSDEVKRDLVRRLLAQVDPSHPSC